MGYKGILKTTQWHRKYWKNRKIDWNQAYMNPDHPHRQVIIDKLKGFGIFRSVLEVGCAAGANLYKIKQTYPGADIGGIDWSEGAIEEAKRMLPRASILQVGEATDIYISSKGADILLSDMCFIYLNGREFRKAIKEVRRVARIGVIFCEFNESNWVKRLLLKVISGYYAHDFKKSLLSEGFHDIKIQKLTIDEWPGTEKEKGLRAVITARS